MLLNGINNCELNNNKKSFLKEIVQLLSSVCLRTVSFMKPLVQGQCYPTLILYQQRTFFTF